MLNMGSYFSIRVVYTLYNEEYDMIKEVIMFWIISLVMVAIGYIFAMSYLADPQDFVEGFAELKNDTKVLFTSLKGHFF